jgi:RNA polymerase sigma-70 factor (ECF subfamily)
LIDFRPAERCRREVAALYASTREGVARYLVTSGMNADTAEEATQEAFLRLYTALRDGEEIRQPKNWVYSVARNFALNAITRNSGQSEFSQALEATIASEESSAETQLIEKEWLENFRDALSRLSERQRLCLELRAQGLRYRDIAEVLEVRISTVSEYVRRGIEELRKWNKTGV